MPIWQGEENIARYFGLRGFKCLCILVKEEINKLRVKNGDPEYTWTQILAKMDQLMIDNKTDDEGPDPT